MNKEEREMITEREEFIKICGILAYSDTHPSDCNYITSFIVGLGKEIEELHNKIDKAIELNRKIDKSLRIKNTSAYIELEDIIFEQWKMLKKDSDVDD